MTGESAKGDASQKINAGDGSYAEVVVGASVAVALPAQGQGEERGQFWVAGTHHDGRLETSYNEKKKKGKCRDCSNVKVSIYNL